MLIYDEVLKTSLTSSMAEDFGPEPQELQEQVAESVEKVREELSEQEARQAQDRLWLNQVGLSTGILSALAAIGAMQGGYLANEGMLAQIRGNDEWALYQARSTKRHLDESTIVVLKALGKPVAPSVTAEIAKLKQQQQDNQTEARKLEIESGENLQRHELFARSVAALQIGISLGAVGALLRQRRVWYLGLGIASIGLAFMLMGVLPIHAPKAPSAAASVAP